MTNLERLALELSVRLIKGEDLAFVLEYANELTKQTRRDALNEALDIVTRIQGHWAASSTALREIIEREA